MADDLDDDWWVSQDKPEEIKRRLSDSDAAADDDDVETEGTNQPLAKKIKTSSGISKKAESLPTTTGESQVHKAKKKKRKKKNITSELAGKEPQSPEPQDLIETCNKYFEGRLSAVELDEANLEGRHFAICRQVGESVPTYLRVLLPKWKKLLHKDELEPGTPLLLIVTSAGTRAVSLIRELNDFKTEDCKIAKLFAKHFKIAEQEKFLKKTRIHIGVGTPSRIQALIEAGALHMEHLRFILFDWSWRDSKQRRLVDIPETKRDTLDLLQSRVIPWVKSSRTKLTLL